MSVATHLFAFCDDFAKWNFAQRIAFRVRQLEGTQVRISSSTSSQGTDEHEDGMRLVAAVLKQDRLSDSALSSIECPHGQITIGPDTRFAFLFRSLRVAFVLDATCGTDFLYKNSEKETVSHFDTMFDAISDLLKVLRLQQLPDGVPLPAATQVSVSVTALLPCYASEDSDGTDVSGDSTGYCATRHIKAMHEAGVVTLPLVFDVQCDDWEPVLAEKKAELLCLLRRRRRQTSQEANESTEGTVDLLRGMVAAGRTVLRGMCRHSAPVLVLLPSRDIREDSDTYNVATCLTEDDTVCHVVASTPLSHRRQWTPFASLTRGMLIDACALRSHVRATQYMNDIADNMSALMMNMCDRGDHWRDRDFYSRPLWPPEYAANFRSYTNESTVVLQQYRLQLPREGFSGLQDLLFQRVAQAFRFCRSTVRKQEDAMHCISVLLPLQGVTLEYRAVAHETTCFVSLVALLSKSSASLFRKFLTKLSRRVARMGERPLRHLAKGTLEEGAHLLDHSASFQVSQNFVHLLHVAASVVHQDAVQQCLWNPNESQNLRLLFAPLSRAAFFLSGIRTLFSQESSSLSNERKSAVQRHFLKRFADLMMRPREETADEQWLKRDIAVIEFRPQYLSNTTRVEAEFNDRVFRELWRAIVRELTQDRPQEFSHAILAECSSQDEEEEEDHEVNDTIGAALHGAMHRASSLHDVRSACDRTVIWHVALVTASSDDETPVLLWLTLRRTCLSRVFQLRVSMTTPCANGASTVSTDAVSADAADTVSDLEQESVSALPTSVSGATIGVAKVCARILRIVCTVTVDLLRSPEASGRSRSRRPSFRDVAKGVLTGRAVQALPSMCTLPLSTCASPMACAQVRSLLSTMAVSCLVPLSSDEEKKALRRFSLGFFASVSASLGDFTTLHRSEDVSASTLERVLLCEMEHVPMFVLMTLSDTELRVEFRLCTLSALSLEQRGHVQHLLSKQCKQWRMRLLHACSAWAAFRVIWLHARPPRKQPALRQQKSSRLIVSLTRQHSIAAGSATATAAATDAGPTATTSTLPEEARTVAARDYAKWHVRQFCLSEATADAPTPVLQDSSVDAAWQILAPGTAQMSLCMQDLFAPDMTPDTTQAHVPFWTLWSQHTQALWTRMPHVSLRVSRTSTGRRASALVPADIKSDSDLEEEEFYADDSNENECDSEDFEDDSDDSEESVEGGVLGDSTIDRHTSGEANETDAAWLLSNKERHVTLLLHRDLRLVPEVHVHVVDEDTILGYCLQWHTPGPGSPTSSSPARQLQIRLNKVVSDLRQQCRRSRAAFVFACLRDRPDIACTLGTVTRTTASGDGDTDKGSDRDGMTETVDKERLKETADKGTCHDDTKEAANVDGMDDTLSFNDLSRAEVLPRVGSVSGDFAELLSDGVTDHVTDGVADGTVDGTADNIIDSITDGLDYGITDELTGEITDNSDSELRRHVRAVADDDGALPVEMPLPCDALLLRSVGTHGTSAYGRAVPPAISLTRENSDSFEEAPSRSLNEAEDGGSVPAAVSSPAAAPVSGGLSHALHVLRWCVLQALQESHDTWHTVLLSDVLAVTEVRVPPSQLAHMHLGVTRPADRLAHLVPAVCATLNRLAQAHVVINDVDTTGEWRVMETPVFARFVAIVVHPSGMTLQANLLDRQAIAGDFALPFGQEDDLRHCQLRLVLRLSIYGNGDHPVSSRSNGRLRTSLSSPALTEHTEPFDWYRPGTPPADSGVPRAFDLHELPQLPVDMWTPCKMLVARLSKHVGDSVMKHVTDLSHLRHPRGGILDAHAAAAVLRHLPWSSFQFRHEKIELCFVPTSHLKLDEAARCTVFRRQLVDHVEGEDLGLLRQHEGSIIYVASDGVAVAQLHVTTQSLHSLVCTRVSDNSDTSAESVVSRTWSALVSRALHCTNQRLLLRQLAEGRYCSDLLLAPNTSLGDVNLMPVVGAGVDALDHAAAPVAPETSPINANNNNTDDEDDTAVSRRQRMLRIARRRRRPQAPTSPVSGKQPRWRPGQFECELRSTIRVKHSRRLRPQQALSALCRSALARLAVSNRHNCFVLRDTENKDDSEGVYYFRLLHLSEQRRQTPTAAVPSAHSFSFHSRHSSRDEEAGNDGDTLSFYDGDFRGSAPDMRLHSCSDGSRREVQLVLGAGDVIDDSCTVEARISGLSIPPRSIVLSLCRALDALLERAAIQRYSAAVPLKRRLRRFDLSWLAGAPCARRRLLLMPLLPPSAPTHVPTQRQLHEALCGTLGCMSVPIHVEDMDDTSTVSLQDQLRRNAWWIHTCLPSLAGPVLLQMVYVPSCLHQDLVNDVAEHADAGHWTLRTKDLVHTLLSEEASETHMLSGNARADRTLAELCRRYASYMQQREQTSNESMDVSCSWAMLLTSLSPRTDNELFVEASSESDDLRLVQHLLSLLVKEARHRVALRRIIMLGEDESHGSLLRQHLQRPQCPPSDAACREVTQQVRLVRQHTWLCALSDVPKSSHLDVAVPVLVAAVAALFDSHVSLSTRIDRHDTAACVVEITWFGSVPLCTTGLRAVSPSLSDNRTERSDYMALYLRISVASVDCAVFNVSPGLLFQVQQLVQQALLALALRASGTPQTEALADKEAMTRIAQWQLHLQRQGVLKESRGSANVVADSAVAALSQGQTAATAAATAETTSTDVQALSPPATSVRSDTALSDSAASKSTASQHAVSTAVYRDTGRLLMASTASSLSPSPASPSKPSKTALCIVAAQPPAARQRRRRVIRRSRRSPVDTTAETPKKPPLCRSLSEATKDAPVLCTMDAHALLAHADFSWLCADSKKRVHMQLSKRAEVVRQVLACDPSLFIQNDPSQGLTDEAAARWHTHVLRQGAIFTIDDALRMPHVHAHLDALLLRVIDDFVSGRFANCVRLTMRDPDARTGDKGNKLKSSATHFVQVVRCDNVRLLFVLRRQARRLVLHALDLPRHMSDFGRHKSHGDSRGTSSKSLVFAAAAQQLTPGHLRTLAQVLTRVNGAMAATEDLRSLYFDVACTALGRELLRRLPTFSSKVSLASSEFPRAPVSSLLHAVAELYERLVKEAVSVGKTLLSDGWILAQRSDRPVQGLAGMGVDFVAFARRARVGGTCSLDDCVLLVNGTPVFDTRSLDWTAVRAGRRVYALAARVEVEADDDEHCWLQMWTLGANLSLDSREISEKLDVHALQHSAARCVRWVLSVLRSRFNRERLWRDFLQSTPCVLSQVTDTAAGSVDPGTVWRHLQVQARQVNGRHLDVAIDSFDSVRNDDVDEHVQDMTPDGLNHLISRFVWPMWKSNRLVALCCDTSVVRCFVLPPQGTPGHLHCALSFDISARAVDNVVVLYDSDPSLLVTVAEDGSVRQQVLFSCVLSFPARGIVCRSTLTPRPLNNNAIRCATACFTNSPKLCRMRE
ncbi:MAG: hypothetical protein MHM6MM_001853 [Cercozoa sp. M6MM]